MEESLSNSSNFRNSLNEVLNDLDVITQENLQAIDDARNYTKEVEELLKSSNEFSNLSSDEINQKLENILEDVITDPENSNLLQDFIQQQNLQQDILQQQASENTEQQDILQQEQQVLGDITIAEEQDDIQVIENIQKVEEELTNLKSIMNELTATFDDTVRNVIEKERIEKNRSDSSSTINMDDLDTESESDGDVEIPAPKNKLFDIMSSLKIDNMDDMFGNMKNLLSSSEKNISNDEVQEKMKEIMNSLNFDEMFKMMGKMNINDDTDDLTSFLIDDKEKDNNTNDNRECELNEKNENYTDSIKNMFNMFNLFDKNKQNDTEIITDSDIDYDENNDEENTENTENTEKDKFTECIEQNKKMFENMFEMMSSLGLHKKNN